MTKRIFYRKGGTCRLIVAPHGGGPTDLRTAEMAKIVAEQTDSWAIINTGWIRPWKGHLESDKSVNVSTTVNVKNGIANLNDIKHCRQEPLRSEFLTPLEEYKNQIVKSHGQCFIYFVHGMDDTIRDYAGVNVILGYGEGNPPRHSCSPRFVHNFLSALTTEGFNPSAGQAGGRLSAWDVHNLNQLFADEKDVASVQIEIALSLRSDDNSAKITAEKMARAIYRA